MKLKRLVLPALVVLVLCCVCFAPLALNSLRPLLPKKLPPAKLAGYGYESGNVQETEAKLRTLFEVAKNNGGTLKGAKIDYRSFFLPDQAYAEDPGLRDKQTVPVIFCDKPESIYFGQLLAFTEIYYYLNLKSSGKNDGATSNPSGFYLVAYTDGTVKRVPPDQLRVYRGNLVFPGMKEYDLSFPAPRELAVRAEPASRRP